MTDDQQDPQDSWDPWGTNRDLTPNLDQAAVNELAYRQLVGSRSPAAFSASRHCVSECPPDIADAVQKMGLPTVVLDNEEGTHMVFLSLYEGRMAPSTARDFDFNAAESHHFRLRDLQALSLISSILKTLPADMALMFARATLGIETEADRELFANIANASDVDTVLGRFTVSNADDMDAGDKDAGGTGAGGYL